ncbi:replicative DNA helicase [Larkinella humicola]|uniref:DNA 5'-3' helicase n=1 Tax=Larkinella humicola TaxID=2607654 RepID=A0A5N1JLA3_9BACT|nr:DnaB-like helicase C-terminal domain-containing protein [Larkinella humicola]KAA9357265.1 hypothetical protein F0P93_05885 [Larkinella humicola]
MMSTPRPNPALTSLNAVPVQDAQLEASILGAILTEPAYYPTAARYLKSAEVFYQAEHQDVWRAMERLAERSVLPGLMDVTLALREQRSRISPAFLLDLTAGPGLHLNFEQRCVSVFDLHHRRKLYQASIGLARDAFDLSVDSREAGSKFRRRLEEMELALPDKKIRTLTESAKEILREMESEKPPFIRSGIRAYDDVIGGYENGCFYIIAARPSMGKSAFVCQNLDGIAVQQNIPAGLLLLEGNDKAMLRRMCTRYGGFSVDDIKQKRITPEQLENALARVHTAPVFIDDTPCTLDRMESRIIRMVLQGAKIVFVDYLQKIRDHRPKVQPTDTVSAISGGLKDLAKTLNIPIVALSQLNRGSESRSGWDKRPVMADLRQSGELEQDADMIAFLFRPEYYGLKEYPEVGFSTANLTEVLIAKNRESAIRTGDDAVVLYHRLAQSAYYSSKGEFEQSAYSMHLQSPF